jgi:hypothetical protein
MSHEVEKLKYKGHTIRLIQDDDAENPREWGNVGEILYTSHRYTLGDKRVNSEAIRAITDDPKNIWLPVYAYIHSGTQLSTGSFRGRAPHADWDSGQCGIIWCSKDRAVKEWGKKVCTKQVIEQAEKYLKGEVETYNQWINGEAVGYTVEGPVCEDSCWGFFPDQGVKYSERYAYPISEAKAAIDYARKARANKLKAERLETRLAREQHLALI